MLPARVPEKQRKTIGYIRGEYHGASEWTAKKQHWLRAPGHFHLDAIDDSSLFADEGLSLAVGAFG